MINDKGSFNMGSFLVCLFIFVLFSVSFMGLANHYATSYDTKITEPYNETFNEMDRLTQLSNDLDISSKTSNESSTVDKITEKVNFAWNVITIIPKSIDIVNTILNKVAIIFGVPKIFIQVTLGILIMLISLAILSIFLKTNTI